MTTKSQRTCVVLADGARARLLTYRWQSGDEEELGALTERCDLVNPNHRLRAGDVHSETRPGLQRAAPGGPGHATDDHRTRHREQEEKRFAAEVARAIGELCQKMGHCRLLMIATPHLLGEVRAVLAKHPDWTRAVVEQVERNRDLSQLTEPQVHDWLAANDLLPPRPRPGLSGNSSLGR